MVRKFVALSYYREYDLAFASHRVKDDAVRRN